MTAEQQATIDKLNAIIWFRDGWKRLALKRSGSEPRKRYIPRYRHAMAELRRMERSGTFTEDEITTFRTGALNLYKHVIPSPSSP